VSLSWAYNPDGRTVNEKEWTFNSSQRIATVVSSGNPQIHSAYSSRVQVSGNTLALSNIQEEDSGVYTFEVVFTTFDPRWIKSDAQLIVVVALQITLRESGPITIDEGNTRTLLCVASENPKPLITWYRNNVKVQEDAGNSNYTITSAKKNDAGKYKCVAAVTVPGLSVNPTEYTVDVTVRFKPEHKVNSLSSNISVVENRDAVFYCRTEAVPGVLEYRWFKNGNQISGFGDYTITTIVDGERLKIKQAKKGSAGRYSCDARNALGTGETKSAYLFYAPQQISVTPADPAEVAVTQSITLKCQTDGFPNPSYSWKFNGVSNGITQNTLTITNADVKDAGNYTCLARNDFGDKETTKVVYVRYQPTVTTFTTGTPGNVVVEGTKVTLTCTANGYPAPTYVIKRENTQVVSNGGKFEITNVQLSEEDITYSCETQNAEGSGPTGQLQIIVLDFSTTISAAPEKVNRDVIYGTVIGILVLLFSLFIIYIIVKRRKGREDNRLEVNAVGEMGPQTNERMEIEGSNENNNTSSHHDASQYMALVEVAQSPGGTGPNISPYLEINEYAPLHPGTRSWEVPRENVIIEKIIGKGAFGQVAQGKASQLRGREETTTVAIKMLKDDATEKERKDLLSELELMKKLKPHPHVIKLLGCVTESDPLLVIIEYVPYGDLLGYLRKSRGLNDTYFKDPDVKPKTSLTSQQLVRFSWQVADGMRYLSSRNIIHRDLAARNVLVGEQETCKVTDFGMARAVNQENIYERKTKSRLPVKWTAYEALLFGRYTTKSDVWSFGIVLYEIFTIGMALCRSGAEIFQ